MMTHIMSVIKDYMGTGFITIIFVMSLSYLAFKEKNRIYRAFFIYVPLVILAAFICPLSLYLYGKASEDVTYYRLLWMIPQTPVIGYAAVKAVSGLEGIKQKAGIIGFALVFALCGSLFYRDVNLVRAENIYHMPQAVVDICDALHEEGREVRVAAPEEMQQFIRQYDPYICLAYGREYAMGIVNEPNELRDELMKPAPDPNVVFTTAVYSEIHYVIVPEFMAFEGEVPCYTEYMRIDGYVIYKNNYLQSELWDEYK